MVYELCGEKVLTEPSDVIEPGKPWNGFDTWQCKLCPYNDTDHERALHHVQRHGIGVEPQKVKTTLVGLDGQPLFMEVTHDGY